MLHDTSKNLLGWFKFRRKSSLRPSLRELAVHAALQRVHSRYQKNTSQPVPLLMGIFTVDCTADVPAPTHSYDYRFLFIDHARYHKCLHFDTLFSKSIKPVALEITNLMHSSQEEYAAFTPLAPFSFGSSSELNQVVHRLPSHLQDLEQFFESRLQQLKVVSEGLVFLSSQQELADQLHVSTTEVLQLEEEIRLLRGQLQ